MSVPASPVEQQSHRRANRRSHCHFARHGLVAAHLYKVGTRRPENLDLVRRLPNDFAPLLQAFQASLQQGQWRKAAEHYQGKGAEQGIYTTQFARHHRKIQREQGDFDAGLFLRIGTGGLWPATRAEDAGYMVADNGRCLMCKVAPDSTKHRAYQCQIVLASEVKETKDTNDLCAAALDHCEAWPCFWLRGLLPLPWLPQVPVPQETQVHSVHGAFGEDALGKINLSIRWRVCFHPVPQESRVGSSHPPERFARRP